MLKSARRSIHPEFRESWILNKAPGSDLAAACGFPRTQLSSIMNAPEVRATSQTVERLQALAQLLSYSGELFR